MKRKICIVTGTRAEYGLLSALMKELVRQPDFELSIIVTGMHLSPEYGLTYKSILEDGFNITAKVEMLLSSGTGVGAAKSMGLGITGIADALDRIRPDVLMLLGDRYETMAAACAALMLRIPIAHIGGGDITEGAIDDAIRHSLTKLAHIHFVSNKNAAHRIMQMGEPPDSIHLVGSLGVEQIKTVNLLGRNELVRLLNLPQKEKNILIAFHPETLGTDGASVQFGEILTALKRMGEKTGLIFTKPNSDPEGYLIAEMIDGFVAAHANSIAFTSLGQIRFLSALAYVDVLVGNSSSGIYEAPTLLTPTVNVGSRQRGRLQAESVINCDAKSPAIFNAIQQAMTIDCSAVKNPYEVPNTSWLIIEALRQVKNYQELLTKSFFEADIIHG